MNALLERLPILVLEPHNRCNCRCVMCDIWKRTDAQEISAAELERHLADIERLGVEWVVFTGGEPLMHSDLFRLSTLLRDRGIRTTILSTGLLLERNAARIVESTDEVIVSLDGPAKIHDEIRRVPGAFESLAKGVRALHEIAPEFPDQRALHRAGAQCRAPARHRAGGARHGTPLALLPGGRLEFARVQSPGGMARGTPVGRGARTCGIGSARWNR